MIYYKNYHIISRMNSIKFAFINILIIKLFFYLKKGCISKISITNQIYVIEFFRRISYSS